MWYKEENPKAGFTLIELLVVVSIIGILASVVLASLGGARGKASDIKIKSQLNSMRNQAELYSGGGIAFGPEACPDPSGGTGDNTLFSTGEGGLGKLLRDIDPEDTLCGSEEGQPSSGKAWAVAAVISTGVWCVEFTGYGGDKNLLGALYSNLPDVIISVSCQ